MSRRKLTARDKKTQKMSRDGVVEINAVTGDEQSISKREADYDIRGNKPERETLSQVGTRLDGKQNNKKTAHSHNEPLRETENPQRQIDPARNNEIPSQQADTVKHETVTATEPKNTEPIHNSPDTTRHQTAAEPSENPRDPPQKTDGTYKANSEPSANDSQHINKGEEKPIFEDNAVKPVHATPSDKPDGTSKLKTRSNEAYQERQPTVIRHESDSGISPLKHQSEKLAFSENKAERLAAPKQKSGKYQMRKHSKYKYKKSFAIQHEPPKITLIGETLTNLRNDTPEGNTFSQVGTRSADSTLIYEKEKTQSADAIVIKPGNKSKFQTQRETALRQNQSEIKTDSQPPAFEMPKTDTVQTEGEQISETADKPHDVPQNHPAASPNNQRNPIIRQGRKSKFKRNRDTIYQHNKPAVLQHEPQKPDSPLAHESETAQTKSAETEQAADTSQSSAETPRNPAETTDNSEAQPKSSEQDAPVDNEADAAEIEQPSADDTATGNKPIKDDNPDSSLKQDKPGKLKFTEDETAPDKKPNRKLVKTERQAEKAEKKLEKAKNKLPAKRKLRSERVFDEKKGKAKRKLHFEKEVKTQGQHLKGALPLRPVKAGANTLMLKAHSKIYQVEHENVAVKAAHRVEMIGEAGVRSALRHHKTAPYRKVAKLEKQAAKKTIKLNYQKALADNPKLKSNMLSRMWQKRKIKKDYAKAARETKKAAKAVKKAGSVTSEAAKLLAGVVRRHPVATAVIILLALLLFMLMSLIGVGGGIGSSGLNAIIASSYLAEDEDIDKAELAYTEWETDLRIQIENTESDRPGYDEYRYNIGAIGHNPYELMAYLTAKYQNFTYDAISADLRAIFDEQYILTFTETTETRYADPTDANEDGDYEPYDWKVLTVTLTSRPFSEVVFSKMDSEQIPHYGILTMSGGGRQYTGSPFDINWLPYVTSGYGYRIHPITGVKDFHRGIDIALPAGTEIRSTQDGTVTFAGDSGGYGNVVVIENADGITTKYAHCNTISVSVGQTVSMGDVIATVGNTGDSTGAHLHYELLKNGEYLNPAYFAQTTT